MKQFTLLFVIIFNSIFISCNIFESENDLDPIEGKVIFSVTYDSTHIIYNHSGFLLLLKTEKIYSCYNYEIISNVSINSGKINVELFGIDIEGLCATAEGPATSLKPLNISEGNYDLNINYMLKKDKYALSVNKLNVSVNQIDTSFTVYQSYNFNF